MAAVAAALATLSLAACSNHGGTAQSLPHARSYQTLRALWRASATAGGPRNQPHVVHAPFSKTAALGRLLPTASPYGAVLVATPGGGFALKDGTPAANALCALFPGRVPRAECDAFAGSFYGGAGWRTVVQRIRCGSWQSGTARNCQTSPMTLSVANKRVNLMRQSAPRNWERSPQRFVGVAVRAVVLVEGESDRIAVERLAARRGRDPDLEGELVRALGPERMLQLVEERGRFEGWSPTS